MIGVERQQAKSHRKRIVGRFAFRLTRAPLSHWCGVERAGIVVWCQVFVAILIQICACVHPGTCSCRTLCALVSPTARWVTGASLPSILCVVTEGVGAEEGAAALVVQRRTSSACRTAPLGPALLCCRERLAICLKSVQHRKGVSDKPESCQLAVQARLSSPQAPRGCDNRALIST